jgi:hypothetical protein
MSTVPGFDNRLIEEARQIVSMTIRAKDHIAASASVATVWSALRHEFLSPKANRSPSAVSRLRKNFDSIDKHDVAPLNRYIVEALKQSGVKSYTE